MDKSIGRQTMIFKVSWQTGFLLLVVRWVSSQTGFIVDKSGLTRQNSVCCWWTVPSQDSWRLCLICSCKRDGMTEYVGKQPCLVKDRMLCRQTSLMTGKSCFFIKSVLTRQKVVTALSCDGRVGTAGWQFSWHTSLMTDKSHDRQVLFLGQVCVDKTERSKQPCLGKGRLLLQADKFHDRQVFSLWSSLGWPFWKSKQPCLVTERLFLQAVSSLMTRDSWTLAFSWNKNIFRS